MNGVLIGVEQRGNSFHSARVNQKRGRPMVEMLSQSLENRKEPEKATVGDSSVVWAVPDDRAIIRPMHIVAPGSCDPLEVGSFELVQSLLEPEDRYLLSVIPTPISHRYLGIAWRKDHLASMLAPISLNGGNEVRDRFRSRAVSLGKGYLGFCRVGEGELIALIDVAPDAAAICLLYEKQVVDIASLSVDTNVFATSEGIDRFAIDLKTFINFKLSSLAPDGVRAPLSVVIISGHGVDEQARNRLTEFFPVGVLAPDFHQGYFPQQVLEATPFLSDYLVALGLTLD